MSKLKLSYAYVATYKGRNIDRISSLRMSILEKTSFFDSIKEDFHFKISEELEEFSPNVFYEPKPYFFDCSEDRHDSDYQKNIIKLSRKLEDLRNRRNLEDDMISLESNYRIFTVLLENENRDPVYFIINKIPNRKQIKHKQFLLIKPSYDVEFVKIEHGFPVSEGIAAIYDIENKQIKVFKNEEFDQIIYDKSTLKKQAEEKFKELEENKFEILNYKIKGIDKEYFDKLNVRHYKALNSYDSKNYSSRINESQFKDAVTHAAIDENHRLKIEEDTINIENVEQFKILISALSERLLLDLLKNKVRTV